jgi:prophage regulatory protein
MTAIATLTPRRVLRIKDVIAVTGIARSGIYSRMQRGSPYYDPDFPKSFKLGKSAVGWDSTAIDRWILSKMNSEQNMQML